MLAKIYNFLKVALIIVLLPVLIIVLPFWLLIFGNKSDVSKDKVLDYLQRMYAGEIDDYWWDDFINVPIKDDELDSIREHCEEIWDPKSGFLSRDSEEGEYYLNESGKAEIAKLISRCESVAFNK